MFACKRSGKVGILSDVLAQSERIKILIKESADELASVENDLHDALAKLGVSNKLKSALEKSNTAKRKNEEALDNLDAMNKALEVEIRDRGMVDLQLAAAQEQEKDARHASFHDPLTGLPNRALFSNRLEHSFAQAKRNDWTLAVMFIDLNRFKDVNDMYGHDAGDSILLTIAQRLKDSTRGDDTISRHGGDEFLYLLVGIRDNADIATAAEKIIKTIEVPCSVEIRNLKLNHSIGASVGIAIYPKDGTTADALIKNADTAMYQAKLSKSCYAFAE
ncbi:MAG: GGDEF domain-containing protein [Haliea sp.]|nr:GGDEF domain-containing protein [Haliea sp.]